MCLSARELRKTVPTLHKSYHIDLLCIVRQMAAVRSTTLRSCLFKYGRPRHFSWRQPEWRQRFKPYAYTRSARTTTATWAVRVSLPDTRSAAKARLTHRGKKNWQPKDFGIFLSLLLLHIIRVPFHIHHQPTVSIFTLFAYPFVITHLSNSYIASWLTFRCETCVYALRMPSSLVKSTNPTAPPSWQIYMWQAQLETAS